MNPRTGFKAALVVLIASFAPLILAQNQLSLGELQEGQIVLNLSLTEQQQVDQDTLNASLQFVTQGRKKEELQNEVNLVMQDAVNLLKTNPDIEFKTSFYQVQIVQTGRPSRTDIENPVFRAQQGLSMSSTDSAALLELIGELQAAGLSMNNLYYSLSSEVHDEISGQLLNAALVKLQTRAEDAASVLGKSKAALIEVSMDGSQNFITGSRVRGSMIFESSADASFSAPVADPGETQVSVSVNARAILSP